jgi:hypothetical protein
MHTILLPTSIHNSTGTDHAGWRAWWQAQASRQGSDWPSLIGLHFTITDSLRSTSS